MYLVTEMVGYQSNVQKNMERFLQLSYCERARYRTKDYLAFFKVTSLGEEFSLIIDSDELVDRLSVSAAMSKSRYKGIETAPSVMLAPIVKSFKDKLFKSL